MWPDWYLGNKHLSVVSKAASENCLLEKKENFKVQERERENDLLIKKSYNVYYFNTDFNRQVISKIGQYFHN